LTNRKSYRINKAGSFKRLKLVEEKIDAPKSGEVQIKVHAIGLNFADIFAILGLYSATPQNSFIPGLEYAGEVIEVGDKVKEFKAGDRVMGVTRFGAYTSHINIDTTYVSPIPESWIYDEGASFLVQALTAYYGLFYLGNMQENDTVLIHSAAGGVGLLANRMAKLKNAYTIGTVGSDSKIDLLKKEGYDACIVRDNHFKSKLQNALNGKPLNLVMDSIGGKIFKTGYDLLASQGRVVVYGSARYGGTGDSPNWISLAYKYLFRPRIDPQKMIEQNKGILGFNLIWLYEQKELMKQVVSELSKLDLPAPFIGHTYQFNEMDKALKLFQSGKTTGKVVIKLS
jgi:alcohol dehydrogenase